MIRVDDFQYELKPWENAVDDDEAMKVWVVNQTMGETEKGDHFEFARIRKDGIEMLAGVLRNQDGDIKALIPAVFSRKHDGVWTQYYYNGVVIDVDADVEAAWRKVTDNGDIDQAVRDWLS